MSLLRLSVRILRRTSSSSGLFYRYAVDSALYIRIARDIRRPVLGGSFDAAVIAAVLADDIAVILRPVVQEQESDKLEIKSVGRSDMNRQETDPGLGSHHCSKDVDLDIVSLLAVQKDDLVILCKRLNTFQSLA